MSNTKTFLSKINRKIIWIIAVLILLAAAGSYAYFSKAAAAQTADDSQVQTAVVQPGDLIVSASGTGTLIANSDATFGFENSGQVKEIYIKVGDQVEAGQVLVQLDDTLAQIEYAEAEQALAELHSAATIATVQKEIATAQDTASQARRWLAYLISPDVVEAEDNLTLAQQKLADAQAHAKANPSDAADQKVKESQAAVTFLQQKLDQTWTYFQNIYAPETFGEYINIGTRRFPKQVLDTYIDPDTGEELPKIDWPSADDLTTARNNYAQAQQTIQDDQSYLEALKTGVIPDGATGERLTTLYEAQLAVENAKSALDATKLVAPMSGTITALDLQIGEQADTTSLITISQLEQPYTLDAYLDETAWEMAQAGNKVNITFDLLPEQTFTGTVTSVDPSLTTSSDLLAVHIVATLDRKISQDLPAGTGVTVEVIGGEAQNALLVPVSALHKTDGKYVVDVIQNGQRVRQEVQIGLKNDTYAEVKSGLEAGATVVTK